jgi:hypothetical protein
VLDLKAKLAAAGVVTKEQVKEFDEKQAAEKRARADKRAAKKKGKGPKGGPGKGRGGKGPKGGPGKGRGGKMPRKERPLVNVDHLKSLNRGEAYDKIRKIVAPRRLDPAGKIIPGPEDKPFNFVTAKGSIGRLYLSDEVAAELKSGKAAISAFMSHHGLAHCVLPKDIAIDLAKVFPLWLRFLHGNPDAGKLEEELQSEEEKASETVKASEASEAGEANAAAASESRPAEAPASPEG